MLIINTHKIDNLYKKQAKTVKKVPISSKKGIKKLQYNCIRVMLKICLSRVILIQLRTLHKKSAHTTHPKIIVKLLLFQQKQSILISNL